MEIFILILLGIVLLLVYGCIGFLVAHTACEIHKNEDTKSLLSFLFYPISHYLNDLTCKNATKLDTTDDEATFAYYVMIIFFWPVRMLFNISCIIVLAVPTLLQAKSKKQPSLIDEATMLTEQRAEIDRRLKEIRQTVKE